MRSLLRYTILMLCCLVFSNQLTLHCHADTPADDGPPPAVNDGDGDGGNNNRTNICDEAIPTDFCVQVIFHPDACPSIRDV